MTTKTYTVAELRHSTMTGSFVRAEELNAEKDSSAGIFQQLEICQKQRDASQGREQALLSSIETANADLAALREELSLTAKMYGDAAEELQQRLADAERRNADQLAMLHMAKELLSTISLHRTMAPNDWCDSFKAEMADRLEKLRTATQPTESEVCAKCLGSCRVLISTVCGFAHKTCDHCKKPTESGAVE